MALAYRRYTRDRLPITSGSTRSMSGCRSTLRGSGEVNVILTVDGQTSNVVTINVQ